MSDDSNYWHSLAWRIYYDELEAVQAKRRGKEPTAKLAWWERLLKRVTFRESAAQ